MPAPAGELTLAVTLGSETAAGDLIFGSAPARGEALLGSVPKAGLTRYWRAPGRLASRLAWGVKNVLYMASATLSFKSGNKIYRKHPSLLCTGIASHII